VLGFAAMDAPHGARDWGRQLARITAVERLHLAATRLFPMAAGAPDAARMEQQERLIRACEGLKQDLAQDRPFRLHQDLAGPLAKVHGEDAALREMADALESLAEAEAAPAAVEPPPREPLFRPDAFSDPAHLKFALRTVLAATACYVFYTAVDWPGIHTAMLTCIILAIPPLGMSSLGGISHKSLVRLLGALLGSGIALFATVFILPRLDGITGLLAMILPVIALAGWITAGSSKSNYVGRQMMFTYVMALLGRFTLTPDIPEIRDRIVGILLGVAVYLALAAFVWPDREGASLRDLLARMVRSLGDLVRAGAEPAAKAPGMHPFDRARAESWKLLRQSRDLQVRVALEPGLTDAPGLSDLDLHAGFARAQETLCAADWLRVQVGQLAPEVRAGLEGELAKFRGCAGRQLEQIAGRLEGSPGAAPLLPSEAALEPAATAKAGEVAATVHALREHITQLGAHLLAGAPQPVERS
jgi:multidrug resistance protein MdtO